MTQVGVGVLIEWLMRVGTVLCFDVVCQCYVMLSGDNPLVLWCTCMWACVLIMYNMLYFKLATCLLI